MPSRQERRQAAREAEKREKQERRIASGDVNGNGPHLMECLKEAQQLTVRGARPPAVTMNAEQARQTGVCTRRVIRCAHKMAGRMLTHEECSRLTRVRGTTVRMACELYEA